MGVETKNKNKDYKLAVKKKVYRYKIMKYSSERNLEASLWN